MVISETASKRVVKTSKPKSSIESNKTKSRKSQVDTHGLNKRDLNKAGYNPSRVSALLTFGITASSPEVKRYLSSVKKVIESLPETSRIARQYKKLGVTPEALTAAIKSARTQKSRYIMSEQKRTAKQKTAEKTFRSNSGVKKSTKPVKTRKMS